MWVTLDSEEGSLNPLYYDAIRMKLKRLAKKSGINIRIHPHLFSHSRCTYMANYLTEAQMNDYFGWVQGSGMSSVYVHLSGRDVDDAILKANGISCNGMSKANIQTGIESLNSAAKAGNCQVCIWVLERRFPEEFGRKIYRKINSVSENKNENFEIIVSDADDIKEKILENFTSGK